MDTDIVCLPAFEASPSSWAHVVGTSTEIFGVVIIVAGILWSTRPRVNRHTSVHPFDEYKMRVRWPSGGESFCQSEPLSGRQGNLLNRNPE
jgi:hypothetical protein